MPSRPAKLYNSLPEIKILEGTVLVDVNGKLAWNLNGQNKKTGQHMVLGSGPCGKNILRKMMSKYNLSFATQNQIDDFRKQGFLNI